MRGRINQIISHHTFIELEHIRWELGVWYFCIAKVNFLSVVFLIERKFNFLIDNQLNWFCSLRNSTLDNRFQSAVSIPNTHCGVVGQLRKLSSRQVNLNSFTEGLLFNFRVMPCCTTLNLMTSLPTCCIWNPQCMKKSNSSSQTVIATVPNPMEKTSTVYLLWPG